jgi:hypothetical protein
MKGSKFTDSLKAAIIQQGEDETALRSLRLPVSTSLPAVTGVIH